MTVVQVLSLHRQVSFVGVFALVAMIMLAMPVAIYAQDNVQDSIEPPSSAQHGSFANPQQELGASTGLPLPRFVSLSSDKVNARSGPGKRYPIEWVYHRDGMPVEVVKEFESWRKVLDIDGQGGWVHVALLSGERTALINAGERIFMRQAPNKNAQGVAGLEPWLVVNLERCIDDWCRVRRADFSGWVERNFLWGIYEGEEID